MILDINDITSYIQCPKLYQLKKEHKPEKKRYISVEEKYVTELNRSIHLFFNAILLDGNISSFQLKSVWGRQWVGKRRKNDILIPDDDPMRIMYRKKEREGFDALYNMFEFFNKLTYEVVAVNMPYIIKFSENCGIECNIPLIINTTDGVKLIDFRMFDIDTIVNKDIRLFAISNAFRRAFNQVENSTGIFQMDKCKLVDCNINSYSQKILIETYKNVARGVSNNIYFRVVSKKCETCGHEYYCRRCE